MDPLAHLNSDDEAEIAVHVCHGCQGEEIPEGLTILLVIEQPHARFRTGTHCLTDDCNRAPIRVRTLWWEQPKLVSFVYKYDKNDGVERRGE